MRVPVQTIVWYPLAASCFLYLAIAYKGRKEAAIPLVPLLTSLLLWIIQGGGWVGDAVSPSIRARSAIWVVLLLGIAAIAVQGLRDQGAPEAQDVSAPAQ